MSYHYDFSAITPQAIRVLASGMAVSLQITAVAMLFGLAWGTVLAVMRLSKFPTLRWFGTVYVNAFRSIPLVMILLWFFLLIPQLLQSSFGLSAASDIRMTSALIAFSLFEAAYYAEIIRAGIKSVAPGQLNSSLALGLSRPQALRLVILPQAFRNMTPLILTQGIILFQDTSLVYVSALADFFGKAYGIGERNGRIIELLFFAGAVYFAICFGASLLVRGFARRHALRRV
jgi:glutamate/aspartate transport system permease protein